MPRLYQPGLDGKDISGKTIKFPKEKKLGKTENDG
jgi:hypothetical protein